MTLHGFKTILHKKCRSSKNSEGPAENSWVLDLCPAKWKQISKSLLIFAVHSKMFPNKSGSGDKHCGMGNSCLGNYKLAWNQNCMKSQKSYSAKSFFSCTIIKVVTTCQFSVCNQIIFKGVIVFLCEK